MGTSGPLNGNRRKALSAALGAAGIAAATGSAIAAAPDYSTPFYLDRWQSPLPFRWVNVTSTNPAFSSGQEYAGVFGGYHDGINDTAHQWDVFCTELNHNIYLNSAYTADVWNTFLNQPILTGTPPDDGGSRIDNPHQITFDQKYLIQGVMTHCLQLPTPKGLDPHQGNYYEQSLFAFDKSGKTPASMSNEQAAATQMLIWEIVHENWDYASHNANTYDPAWLKANAYTVVDLNSGWLAWSFDDTILDSQGHNLSYYFNAEKNCVLNYYFQSVPEATTVLMGAIAVWPFLMVRRRMVQA